jgi:hypothetical protein
MKIQLTTWTGKNMFSQIARMLRNGSSIPTIVRTFVFEDPQPTMVLYPTYSGLVYSMLRGNVYNFDNGLFVFSCTREHAMDENSYYVQEVQDYLDQLKEEGEENSVDYLEELEELNQRKSVTSSIRTAVLKAEKEGRIHWRTLEDRSMCYDMIDGLLIRNHQPRLLDYSEHSYNYPELTRLTSLQVVPYN